MTSHRLHPPSATIDVRRRQYLGAAAAGLLAIPLVPAAAAAARTMTVPRAQLQQMVTMAFPYRRSFGGGLAQLSLESPRLSLLPERNRLGTALDLAMTETITGQRHRGRMDLDYGLRFDADAGSVRMADVHVAQLLIDSLPPAQRVLVSQYAPPLAEQLLNEWPLYRVPPEQLELMRNLGWAVKALRVTASGLRIDLAPALF